MILRSAVAVLGCVVSFLSSSVNAATINFDEAVSGDIEDVIGLNDFFTFGIGVNTISGSTKLYIDEAAGTFDVDHDAFEFEVVTGSQINSITYSFTNVDVLPGTTALGLGMDGPPYLGFWSIDVTSDLSPQAILIDEVPFPEGVYGFGYYLETGGSLSVYGGSWDYTLTFEVGEARTVPESAFLSLMVLGLTAIGYRRRQIKLAQVS